MLRHTNIKNQLHILWHTAASMCKNIPMFHVLTPSPSITAISSTLKMGTVSLHETTVYFYTLMRPYAREYFIELRVMITKYNESDTKLH
jgi:hypothetical protein